ncbi:MAG: response regulator transcription factor [Actinomycetota bacterium]|nr:response regulator transcription factor [Actinomycetota bacterium]
MGSSVVVIASEPKLHERLVALLRAGDFDVVVRDGSNPLDVPSAFDAAVVACPATDPTPLLREASVAFPGSRVVAVLPTVLRHAVRRTLRAGASALVRLEDIDTTLVLAVESACAGQLSVPFDLADGLEKPILSSREKQILGMVVMGMTNGQIARRLFLAESTVKSHMSSIFAELGVASRKEAAALVLDPDEGLGLGILAISEEPSIPTPGAARAGTREETAA